MYSGRYKNKMRQLLICITSAYLSSGFVASAQAQSSIVKRESLRLPVLTSKEVAIEKNSDEATPLQLLPFVEDIKLFKLLEPVDNFNAITQFEFSREEKSKIFEDRKFTVKIDGKETINFNDQGFAPDIKPGDGVFTGFSRVDFEEIERDEQALLKRLSRSKVDSVKVFSGRAVTSTSKFSVEHAIRQKDSIKPEKLQFGKNVVAVRIPSIFNTISSIPFTADENKVLGINNVAVVANPGFTYDPCNTDGTGNDVDPDAPWSFKTLMSNLNQGTGLTDQEFIHNWLSNWINNTSVNGQNIPARPAITDYFPGWNGINPVTLDVDNLPFRLLSIMNRLDLAKVGYSGVSSQGETRFVFGLLNPNTCGPAVGIDQMTAILEYGDPASSCSSVKSRAQQWLELDDFAVGSPIYMNKLKTITDNVTLAPAAAATLNQLRTNDFAFDGIGALSLPWSLREFVVDVGGSGLLEPATTKQTPPTSLRASPITAEYIEGNAANVLCESYVVPDTFTTSGGLTVPFLAASLDYLNTSFWAPPVNQANLPASFPSCHSSSISSISPFVTLPTQIQSEARHKFSVNTCDDCHARETNTTFTHISPVTRNFSGFMTGVVVDDPLLGGVASGGIEREFDDLQRRGQIVQDLAVRSCKAGIFLGSPILQANLPLQFTH